jgi:hypothetical protein
VDREKITYINHNVKKHEVIQANYSNPLIEYAVQKQGYSFTQFAGIGRSFDSEAAQKQALKDYLASLQTKYIFIGALPSQVDPGIYIYQFSNYEEATKELNLVVKDDQLVKQFSDGSRLYLFKPAPAPKKK